MRVGVVLINLGAPDSMADIPRYLRSLLADPAVVPLPWPLRNLLAAYVSRKRASLAAAHYAAIGGRSPLHEQTRMQAQALGARLGASFVVRHAMRHCSPSVKEVFGEFADAGIERVLAIPLYPQYSQSTTGSALDASKEAASSFRLQFIHVCSYPEAAGYINSIADQINALREADDHLLFCAHGLPLRTINRGDPYLNEVQRTVNALVSRLGHGGWWSLAFQSRVGRMPWTEPYLGDELTRLAKMGKRSVLLVPISFVCENLETLYELDMEYVHLAQEAGITRFRRVPTPGTHPSFIDELVQQSLRAVYAAGWTEITASANG